MVSLRRPRAPGDVVLNAVGLAQLARWTTNDAHPPSTDSEIANFYASLHLPETSPRSVRVVQLDAVADDDNNAPLSGTMRVISLDDKPRYTALSYVWGSFGTPPDTIECNSVRLPISTSCREALVELRKLCGAITIWIDAICINQKDISDKNAQIPLMGDIYTWADATYIWLGPETPGSRAIIKWLDEFSRARLSMQDLQLATTKTRLFVVWLHMCKALYTSTRLFFQIRYSKRCPKYDAGDLQDLLGRPWLTRAWTFQEMILSPNPVFVCGAQAIHWDRFICGLQLMQLHPWWSTTIKQVVVMSRGERILSPMVYMGLQKNFFRLPEDTLPDIEPWLSLIHVWMAARRSSCWHRGSVSRLQNSLNPPSILASQRRLAESLEPSRWLGYMLSGSIFALAVSPTWLALLLYASIYSPFVILFWFMLLFVLMIIFWCCSGIQLYEPVLPNEKQSAESSEANEQTSILLKGIVHALRHRGATNPLDRSYALTGVLSALGIDFRSAVNYGKTKGCVYHDLLIDMFHWDQSTILLLLDVRPQHLADAPSWVPDWNVCASRSTWFYEKYLIDAIKDPRQISSADDDIVADICDNAQRHQLRVNIQHASIIHSVFGPFRDFDISRAANEDEEDLMLQVATAHVLRWLRQARMRARATAFYNSLSVVAYRTLQAAAVGFDDIPDKFNEVYSKLLAALDRQVSSESSDFENDLLQARSLNDDLGEDRKSLVQAFELLSQEDRCLIVTKDGLLGTGFNGLQPDDMVAIVSGIPTPFGLRPVTSKPEDKDERAKRMYQALGPLYVEGLMSGELADGKGIREVYLV